MHVCTPRWGLLVTGYVLALSNAEVARYRMTGQRAAGDEADQWAAAGIAGGPTRPHWPSSTAAASSTLGICAKTRTPHTASYVMLPNVKMRRSDTHDPHRRPRESWRSVGEQAIGRDRLDSSRER